MRRVLSAVAACLAATTAVVVGGAAPASAAACDTPVLASPVHVSFGITNWTPNYVDTRVCVGAGGIAYQEWEVRVHPYGSPGAGACSTDPENYTGAGTNLVAVPNQLGVSGHVGTGTSPRVCDNGNGTFNVVLPVGLCVGVACPVSHEVGTGTTGLVVGTVGTGAPGGTTGGGVQLHGTELWVAGNRFPIGPDVVAAGVGNASGGVGTAGTVVCGPLDLVCVPGSAGVYYNGGSILGVSVLGLGTTYVQPLGYTCVPVFTVGGAPRPC